LTSCLHVSLSFGRVSVPFARKTEEGLKQILYKRGRRELTNLIEDLDAKDQTLCTNGGHYALVANGRPTLAGCITTAVGGPFDIAGLLHVVEAGGVAQCYEVNETAKKRKLTLLSPKDIENADMVIATNNEENLIVLEKILRKSVRYKS